MTNYRKVSYAYETRLLCAAVRCNNKKDVQYALEQGACTSDENLIDAIVFHADSEIVQLLLQSNANPNALSRSRLNHSIGETALYVATKKRNQSAMRLLIEAGAHVNQKGKAGQTPLHVAIFTHFLSGVQLLLRAGANVYTETNKRDGGPVSPLQIACWSQNIPVLDTILKSGVCPDVYNSNGQTVLMEVVQFFKCPDMWSTVESIIDVMNCLLRYGASVHAVSKSGLTALQYACQYKVDGIRHGNNSKCVNMMVEMIKVLLQSGANVNVVDSLGSTTLMNLINSQRKSDTVIKIGELLLKAGLDINAKNSYGRTAITEVCADRQDETTFLLYPYLIDCGANVNARYGPGNSAFVHINLGYKYEDSPIYRTYYLNTFKWLIYGGVDLNETIKNTTHLYQTWKLYQKEKIQLKYQCRLLIRDKLFKYNKNCIAKKVHSLCLPSILKKYILLPPSAFCH